MGDNVCSDDVYNVGGGDYGSDHGYGNVYRVTHDGGDRYRGSDALYDHDGLHVDWRLGDQHGDRLYGPRGALHVDLRLDGYHDDLHHDDSHHDDSHRDAFGSRARHVSRL